MLIGSNSITRQLFIRKISDENAILIIVYLYVDGFQFVEVLMWLFGSD